MVQVKSVPWSQRLLFFLAATIAWAYLVSAAAVAQVIISRGQLIDVETHLAYMALAVVSSLLTGIAAYRARRGRLRDAGTLALVIVALCLGFVTEWILNDPLWAIARLVTS